MTVEEDVVVHDEVEIEDFEYDIKTGEFRYPCPCGDEFVVLKDQLLKGEKYARCPSCSLIVQVIYNEDDLMEILKKFS